MDPIIIIGTGFAGYTLAREFRKLDSQTPLIFITSDDGRSYPKPMLSNALTKGKTAEQLALSDSTAMAKTLNAEIMTHTIVSHIDPQAKIITTTTNKRLNYQQLVLAVGAKLIHIPIKGRSSNNIISINSLDDYSVFREQLNNAKHVTLIGPGLIGCEFANDLLNAKVKVSIVGPDAYPMSSLLPQPIAEELKSTLEAAGVDWHLNTTTTSIVSTEDGYQLTLENGDSINTDIVISAVGLRSNTELAELAGLKVSRGIVTNNYLQTSHTDIYALGDCAEVAGHNLLFIAPILVAARALAKTLSGTITSVKYPAMPVAIKTPYYPLVVSPPSQGSKGNWLFESSPTSTGIKGLFIGANNMLLGFVLSGDMISDKQALTKQLPVLLS
ncbi:MAG: FAD-dependent oxidoreductase [Piscirickettsiaceae bacterium]|nr:FAD-dependent oxidoreductase [Piscirickettsiaceae bacterium]